MDNSGGSITGKTPYIYDDASGSSVEQRNKDDYPFCPICRGTLKSYYAAFTFIRVGHKDWCSRYGEPHPAEAE